MRLSGGRWVDAGSQGNIVTLPGGGKGRRATAPYNCPVGKTYKYQAWVDVDLLHYIDPAVIKLVERNLSNLQTLVVCLSNLLFGFFHSIVNILNGGFD